MSATYWAWRSVGKPGWTQVAMSTGPGGRTGGRATRNQSSPTSTSTPARQHPRHQHVVGPGHGRQVEHDPGAPEPAAGRGDEVPLPLVELRPHLAQAADVLLDPPGTDLVAAGPGDPGVTAAAQQRPQ